MSYVGVVVVGLVVSIVACCIVLYIALVRWLHV